VGSFRSFSSNNESRYLLSLKIKSMGVTIIKRGGKTIKIDSTFANALNFKETVRHIVKDIEQNNNGYEKKR